LQKLPSPSQHSEEAVEVQVDEGEDVSFRFSSAFYSALALRDRCEDDPRAIE
jgi:hypothetical protein